MKKPTKYYAIVCRIPNDENQTVRVTATTPKEARRKVEAAFRKARPEEYRQAKKDCGHGIYIDAVLESDTEIREVIP